MSNEESFGDRICDQLKKLLESKHLYQSIQIDLQGLAVSSLWVDHEWNVIDPSAPMRGFFIDNGPDRVAIRFKMPDLKLYCKICKGIEAFNAVSGEDFLGRGVLLPEPRSIVGEAVQVFALSFLCQSCKLVPEVFLVKRKGLKLTLSGRSEIEHVDVPKTIPKEVQDFYSGAIVAHQSGETLAGIFMLRTLIEQRARKETGDFQSDASAMLDKYMATLPRNFNNQFPSMRDLYGDLSTDIHSAAGSSELFDRALTAIEEHFDARHLFKL